VRGLTNVSTDAANDHGAALSTFSSFICVRIPNMWQFGAIGEEAVQYLRRGARGRWPSRGSGLLSRSIGIGMVYSGDERFFRDMQDRMCGRFPRGRQKMPHPVE